MADFIPYTNKMWALKKVPKDYAEKLYAIIQFLFDKHKKEITNVYMHADFLPESKEDVNVFEIKHKNEKCKDIPRLIAIAKETVTEIFNDLTIDIHGFKIVLMYNDDDEAKVEGFSFTHDPKSTDWTIKENIKFIDYCDNIDDMYSWDFVTRVMNDCPKYHGELLSTIHVDWGERKLSSFKSFTREFMDLVYNEINITNFEYEINTSKKCKTRKEIKYRCLN